MGCLAATSVASSRLAHSSTSKPAIHSLVSANGPSVVRTLPFRLRTVTALSTPARRLPVILTPLPSISATHESILSCFGSYVSPVGSPHTNIRYRIVAPLSAGQAGLMPPAGALGKESNGGPRNRRRWKGRVKVASASALTEVPRLTTLRPG